MSSNLGLLDEVDVALAQPSPVRLLVDIALNEVFSVEESLHQLDIWSKICHKSAKLSRSMLKKS